MPDVSHRTLPALLTDMRAVKTSVDVHASSILSAWEPFLSSGTFIGGAQNLAAYLALRQHDLSGLQAELSLHGLSSLGRSESRVLESLTAVENVLATLCGEKPYETHVELNRFFAGDQAIADRTRDIFGPDPTGPQTRIMVTLPSEAAADSALISDLVTSGVDAFRINCAHDSPEVWDKMTGYIRAAERAFDRRLPIMMDLAGPKCRIEDMTRKNKRLFVGDRFKIAAGALPEMPDDIVMAATLSLPEVLSHAQAGQQVWIDDGRIGGQVEFASADELHCIVTHADAAGEKVKLRKGVNFPDTEITIDPLTDKDVEDLDFVAAHADIVGFSFVQRVSDVARLQSALAARGPRGSELAIALKIETRLALRNLPDLMVASASQHPTTVMIARGDLGVEVGFERLSEIQEQVLWLCHAAQLPVIWATQVAESIVKHGKPIRGEVTDVAMAQRAECVMLNKGPHIVSGAQFVDNILRRMDAHQFKKAAKLSPVPEWMQGSFAGKEAN